MSRIVAVTWDGGGNVPPLMHTAVELQARGHQVRVLGHRSQRQRFAAANLDFVPYRHALPWSRVQARGQLELLERFADGRPGRDLDELLDEWDADVAVVDCLMLGPLQAAQAHGLPTVALVHSFWAQFGERFPMGPITEMAVPHGREPRRLWDAATEVLVASDRELDPVQTAIPSNVRWTGVAQPPVRPSPRSDRRRVLLSLSTVWFPGQQESIQQILDALGGLPIEVVATIDRNIVGDRLRFPANVRVHSFVEHGEVMPTVSLLIGHGGHATTMYALAHNLPVLVIPQYPMADQRMIGEVLAAHGAGAVVDQHPRREALQSAIMRLLDDDAAAQAAAAIGSRIRGHDGIAAAADRVEDAVGARVEC
jgi:UDP:flavonoid glycosyltransferase YjiC (YdhE family)